MAETHKNPQPPQPADTKLDLCTSHSGAHVSVFIDNLIPDEATLELITPGGGTTATQLTTAKEKFELIEALLEIRKSLNASSQAELTANTETQLNSPKSQGESPTRRRNNHLGT